MPSQSVLYVAYSGRDSFNAECRSYSLKLVEETESFLIERGW